jgi:hypothetical protein
MIYQAVCQIIKVLYRALIKLLENLASKKFWAGIIALILYLQGNIGEDTFTILFGGALLGFTMYDLRNPRPHNFGIQNETTNPTMASRVDGPPPTTENM